MQLTIENWIKKKF